MSAVSRRDALGTLTRARLAELVRGFDLDVGSRASKAELIDALARSRRAAYEKILDTLKRDELKAICRAHELDDSGRAKNVIIERILGRGQLDLVSTEAEAGDTKGPKKRRGRRKKRADANVDTDDIEADTNGNGKMTLQRLESRHPDHSQAFWHMVAGVLSDFAVRRAWLAARPGWSIS